MSTAAEPWTVLADVLLQREALICRLAEGRPPRDFAGLFVDHDDLDRILATLPGLDGPSPERAAAVRDRVRSRVERARGEFAASLAGPSRFAALIRGSGLPVPDAEVLALVAAVELAPARQRLVAYLQDSIQLPQPTLATLARVFAEPDHPAERCLAPDAPLLRAELVRVAAAGAWATRAGTLPDRVAWYLVGDGSADPDLPAGAERRLAESLHAGGQPAGGPPAGPCPGEPRAAPRGGLLLVNGGDRESRMRQIRGRWPGRGWLNCPVPRDVGQWAAVVREATLGDLVVVLDLAAPLDAAGRDAVLRAAHLTWVLSTGTELPLETVPALPWREIRVSSGAADEQDWQRALGRPPDPAYRLGRDQLRLVAAAAAAAATPAAPAAAPAAAGAGGLAPAVRRLAGGHLDGVATRIRPRRGWADLIVPADDARQLRELAARHRGREIVYRRWGFPPFPSTGTVALFAGASGTGKTLAAEVLAGELGLDLYKVDLSAVVSKYIGETEKNLERIFGAAEAGDLVLFFDEADALFGKRSEVSDAHDRYANIEVAYLLQRLETYDGLVVLATNLQRNIDQAFLRRIAIAIDFVLPEREQRRAIWERSFPPTAPVTDLDLDFLARQFKISGGVIHNAALGAGFLAAEEAAPISMRHVVLAMKREFQKLGRLRTEVEFERYFDLVRDADAAPAR